MIACNGWLIFGENFGVFEPVYPDQGNLRHFIITISILVITAVAVQLISNSFAVVWSPQTRNCMNGKRSRIVCVRRKPYIAPWWNKHQS
jgi:hypothetical protein